jgi:hypothetical protein
MDSAIPMLVFLGLLMVVGVLVLACGIQSREEERKARRADPRRRQDLLAGARFFAAASESELADPVAVVVDRAQLTRVEEFLRAGLALAELHVADPGVQHLQEPATVRETHESLLHRLERFLDHEHTVVTEFVLNPSIALLYVGADLVPEAA